MATDTSFTAPWRSFASPQGLRLPHGLAERLDAGETILFGGRSSSGGSKGRDLAARDVLAAVEQFSEQSGLDFRSLVPSLEDVTHRLAAARSETFDGAGGERFSCRFVLIDLVPEAQIALLVATSSGAKVTVDDRQPFVARAAQEYKRLRAAVFAVKELDRSGRQDWGLAPIMMAIEANDGSLSDENGCGPLDMGRSMTAFVQGTSAKKMAVGVPKRTRREQRNRTGTLMVEGQVACHLSSPPPPGFGVCWLKGDSTNPKDRILYLDNDACRPAESTVASGLGSVRYPEGHERAGGRVDQVENVRYVLSHLGRPGHTKRSIVRELAARSYSTVMLRGHHDPGATVSVEHGAEVLDAIIANLKVYEFGVLDRGIGAGLESLAIEGCVPPDGPWAGPADFARIRAYLKESDASTEQDVNLTFSGLRITFNGSPAVMISEQRARARRAKGEPPHYNFARAEGYPKKSRAVPDNRLLSATVFAESIVQGIIGVDGVMLESFDPERFGEPRDAKLEQLRVQRTNLQSSAASLAHRKAALGARLFELDDDGVPVLRGALFRKAQADYNLIAEHEETELAHRLRQLDSEISERESHLPRSSPVEQLLHLVASLRDPTDRSYRGHWLASIKEVSFTSGTETKDDLIVKAVSWTGLLVLEAHGEAVSIPFGGSYEYGTGMRNRDAALGLVNDVISQLREGVPFDPTSWDQPTLVLPQVASAFGISASHMLLQGCRDPRILMIATALLESPSKTDADIADTFGESRAFVSRVRSIHRVERPTRTWVRAPDPVREAFYSVAAANGGLVTAEEILRLVPSTSLGQIYNLAMELRRTSARWSTRRKKGYALAPCDCGSVSAAIMAIPEPIGAVCQECRKDEGGLTWPAEPYDAYVTHVAPDC